MHIATDHKYVEVGNCRYYVSRTRRGNFTSANSSCSNMNGSLAMLKTDEIIGKVIKQVIDQYLEATQVLQFWIGGRTNSSKYWLWLDQTPVHMTLIQDGDGPQGLTLASNNTMLNATQWYGSNLDQDIVGRICEVPGISRFLSFNYTAPSRNVCLLYSNVGRKYSEQKLYNMRKGFCFFTFYESFIDDCFVKSSSIRADDLNSRKPFILRDLTIISKV